MKRTEILTSRIKLQQLRVFAAVAQTGSMVKAARQLAISQPVVSKVVADLEDLLEVRLFDRSPQGVTPTLYGHALFRRSAIIFDDIKTTVDEINFLSDPTLGELRFGSTEPVFAGLGTAALERLWTRHPQVASRVVQADSRTLIERELIPRRIELALMPLRAPLDRDDLETTMLYRDFWHVVAGKSSPWARRRKILLEELVDEPWCATPLDTEIGSLLYEPFRAKGLKPPHLAVSSVLSPHTVVRLLEGGRLLTVMADSLLNHFFAGRFAIKTLAVELSCPTFHVAVVTVKHRTISPLARYFIDRVREIAAELEERRARVRRSPA